MSKLTDFSQREPAPSLLSGPKKAIEAPDPQNGIAGELRFTKDNNKIYVSKRKRNKHYFRKYEGYAISQSILDILETKKIWNVLIVEELNHKTLKYNTKIFLNDKFSNEVSNEGEKQCVVPEKFAKEWDSTPTVVY